jgi:hypothetical protein
MPVQSETGWSDRFGTIYVHVDSINKLSKKNLLAIIGKSPTIQKKYKISDSAVSRLEFKLGPLEPLDYWGNVKKYFPRTGTMGERRVLNFPKHPSIEEYWVENGIKWGNFFKVNIKRRGGVSADKTTLDKVNDDVRTMLSDPTMAKKGYLVRQVSVKRYGANLFDLGRPRTPKLPPVPLVSVPEPDKPADPGTFQPGLVAPITYKKVVSDIEDTIGFNPWWLVAGAGVLMILKGLQK